MQNEVAQATTAGVIVDFAATTVVDTAVGNFYRAAASTVRYPADFAASLITTVAAKATSWVIMTTAKLALTATCYIATTAATGAVNGASRLFSRPAKLEEEHVDFMDPANGPLAPLTPDA